MGHTAAVRRLPMILVVLASGCGGPAQPTLDSLGLAALLQSVDWTAQGTQAGSELGYDVSAGDVDGDGFSDLLVGAPEWDGVGAAFLFPGGPDGPVAAATWSTVGTVADARVGHAVSCAGDVDGDGLADLVVGAPGWGAGQAGEGAARLWLGSAAGPSAAPHASWESDQAGAGFGTDVAAAGDVNGDEFGDVLVGCPACADGEVAEGQAFLFLGGTGGPGASPTWTGESDQAGAGFGGAVAAAGDLDGDGFGDLVVGAEGWNGAADDVGAVFVWLGDAAGPGGTADWSVAGDQEGALLGRGVAGVGDVDGDGYADLLVGEPKWDSGSANVGRAHLFSGSAGGPVASPGAVVVGAGVEERLGRAVAGLGDVNGDGFADAAIGAYGADDPTVDEGTVGLYLGSPAGLSAPDSTLGGDQDTAHFGFAVAGGDVNGDGFGDLVTGARWYDGAAGADTGAAFAALGGPGLPGGSGWLPAPPSADDAALGSFLAGAGDVDADGYDDLLVGVPGELVVLTDDGEVRLYSGGPDGPSVGPDWTTASDQAGAAMGPTAGVGDVDGDGYDDVLVAAPGWASPTSGMGIASLYLGGPAGLDSSSVWTLAGTQGGGQLGYCMTGGDLDGDGLSDLVVTTPFWDEGGNGNAGRVQLFAGASPAPAASSSWELVGTEDGGQLGLACAVVGDLDGDGVEDLALGEPGFDGVHNDGGRVAVFLGDAAGLPSSADLVLDGPQVSAGFGSALARAGDLTGDGFADLVVGAPNYDGAANDTGLVQVFPGSATGPSAVAQFAFSHTDSGASLGTSLAAGDVDGDGFSDLLIGVPDAGTNFRGEVHLFLGSAAGPSPSADLVLSGPEAFADFGQVMAGVGDVDGDGRDDIVVGDPLWDGGDTNSDQGGAWLYRGGGDASSDVAWPAAAVALQPGGAAPLPAGALSVSADLDLALTAASSAGAARARLQVEGQPAGSPFVGSVSWESDLLALPAGGVEIQETIDAFLGQLAYHYRWRLAWDLAQAPPVPVTPWVHGGRGGDVTGVHLRTWPDSDADGDPDSTDCAPEDPTIYTGATELCDTVDNDCSGAADDPFDLDLDGVTTCGPDGVAGNADDDCDDADAANQPGGVELCDAADNDCGGDVDEGLDVDGDGLTPCGPDGVAGNSDDDCDDADPDNYAGNPEVCDAADNDCDGEPDQGLDDDGDGVTPCGPDGVDATADDDCDDADPDNFAGNVEACDGSDNDCDGAVDNGFDDDGDGWPGEEHADACGDAWAQLDCDDLAPAVHPGAEEVCNALDDDCDGDLLESFADSDGDGLPDCADPDADGDGEDSTDFGGPDCDDDDPAVNTSADEVCNGVDDDCDGDLPADEADGDGDSQPPCAGDCDDDAPTVYDGAAELCDGLDNDCDGLGDLDEPDVTFFDWFRDVDEDGFGNPEAPHPSNPRCEPPLGYVADASDCDDNDAAVNVEAEEVDGDGIDNDCDGRIDRGGSSDRPPAPGLSCSGDIGGGSSGWPALLLLGGALGVRRRSTPGRRGR